MGQHSSSSSVQNMAHAAERSVWVAVRARPLVARERLDAEVRHIMPGTAQQAGPNRPLTLATAWVTNRPA